MSKQAISLSTLRERRDEIIAIAERHGAFNVRVISVMLIF